jgi:hypothetical protein
MHRHPAGSWRFLQVEHRWWKTNVYFLCHECGEVFIISSREMFAKFGRAQR